MKKLLVFTLLIMSVLSFGQQPWTRKWKQAYIQSGVSLFRYSRAYDTPAKFSKPSRSITQLVFTEYGEIGLSNRLMLTLNIPIQLIHSGKFDTAATVIPGQGTLVAFGNCYGGLTFKILDKDGFVMSASMGVYGKTAIRNNVTGLQSGYQAFGYEPMILAGWGSDRHFWSAGVGVNIRTAGYSAQQLLKMQWGSKIGKRKRSWFILGLNTCLPLGQKTSAENLALDGLSTYTYLYPNRQGYVGIDMKWGYQNNGWAGWFSLAGGPGWKVGQAGVFTFSIGKEIDKTKKKPKPGDKSE